MSSAVVVTTSLGFSKCAVKNVLEYTIFGPSDTDFPHLTANISKTVSRSVTCQLEIITVLYCTVLYCNVLYCNVM